MKTFNNTDEFYRFIDSVRKCHTYQHGFYVHDGHMLICANMAYDAARMLAGGVFRIDNVYDTPEKYEVITGVKNSRAYEYQAIIKNAKTKLGLIE